jgi:hypothetical protein
LDKNLTNVGVGLKVGGSLTELVHPALGTEVVALPVGRSAFGHVYGVATLGTPDANVSVSAGVPFSVGGSTMSGFFSTGTFAGTLRLTNHLAFVTENRLQFAERGSPQMSYGLGVRVFGKQWAVVPTPSMIRQIPSPWKNIQGYGPP